MIFCATDIDYMANNFSVEQLRKELSNARKKLHGEPDWEWQIYYKDYIEAVRLALEIRGTVEPKPKYENNRESIESIKSRYDLVDYIGQYINLKKSGGKFQGLCPFHADNKSPSFFVYPDNNTFHCYGCQAHGSIIDFVMRYDNLDIKSAIAKLSR